MMVRQNDIYIIILIDFFCNIDMTGTEIYKIHFSSMFAFQRAYHHTVALPNI